MVERQARDLEVYGSNFSLDFKFKFLKAQIISLYVLVNLI